MNKEIKDLLEFVSEKKVILDNLIKELKDTSNKKEMFEDKESIFYKNAEEAYQEKLAEYKKIQEGIKYSIEKRKKELSQTLKEEMQEINTIEEELTGKYKEAKQNKEILDGEVANLKWLKSTLSLSDPKNKETIDNAEKRVKDMEDKLNLTYVEIMNKTNRKEQLVPKGKQAEECYLERQELLKDVETLNMNNLEEIKERIESREDKNKSKTEPAKTEPVKTEPVKTEPVKTQPVKTESIKTEPVKTEPVKTQPVKTQPVKKEPIKTEPVKTEPVKVRQVKTKSDKDPVLEKYENEGFGKNVMGWYFNPWIDEYDPDYDPHNDKEYNPEFKKERLDSNIEDIYSSTKKDQKKNIDNPTSEDKDDIKSLTVINPKEKSNNVFKRIFDRIKSIIRPSNRRQISKLLSSKTEEEFNENFANVDKTNLKPKQRDAILDKMRSLKSKENSEKPKRTFSRKLKEGRTKIQNIKGRVTQELDIAGVRVFGYLKRENRRITDMKVKNVRSQYAVNSIDHNKAQNNVEKSKSDNNRRNKER